MNEKKKKKKSSNKSSPDSSIKASWTDLSIRHINFVLKTSNFFHRIRVSCYMARFPFFIIFISVLLSFARSLELLSSRHRHMTLRLRRWGRDEENETKCCDNDKDERERIEMAKSIISGVVVMQQDFLSHFLQIYVDPTRESFATLNSSSWIIFTGFSFICNLFYVMFPFFLLWGGVRRRTENCAHKLISSLARDYLRLAGKKASSGWDATW